MSGFRIAGATSNNLVEVNASNQAKVITETDVAANPGNVGALRLFSENDPGSITGEAYLKSPETSPDYRLRVGVDTLLFNDNFNASAQNISQWKHTFAVMTMTQSAGFLNVNAAGTSTASGNQAFLQTWRYFPLFGTGPLSIELKAQFDRTPVANEIYHMGMGIAVAAAEPVDGVWFEYTSAGVFGCLRYNSGTTVKTSALKASVTVNTVDKYTIVVGLDEIEFWIDDVLYGELAIPAAQGQPFLTTSLPIFIQKYNSGVVGSSPNVIAKVAAVTVSLMDIASNQTWANQMASCGLGMQALNGGSATSPQVQWANTALPTAAAATNTTAALGAFLGGLFQMNAPATSATDVIIASYQNPAGGVNQTPRTMKLRGIKIDCVNQVVAVATTGTVFAVAVAWGGSTLTLAATESTTFQTATTKLRRIQPIGVISFPVAAAVGAQATTIQFDFEAPIIINPGEFIQVVC
jgi:hypothetical protein